MCLFQCGYDINKYHNADGNPAIHLAVARKDLRLLKVLFEIGCDFNQTDKNGLKPFRKDSDTAIASLMKAAAEKPPNSALVLKIFQSGIGVNAEDEKGQTALFKACQGGNESNRLVQTLLDEGADIHHRDHDGNTPIIVTCKRNHEKTAMVLLAAGANVNDKNNSGTSAIHNAAALSKATLLKYLIQEGANVNDADKNGYTPIMLTRVDTTCEMLLTNGATLKESESNLLVIRSVAKYPSHLYCTATDYQDLTTENKKKRLIRAFRCQSLGETKEMLENGISPNITLDDGKTLLQTAIEKEKFGFAHLFVKHGAQHDYLSESLYVVAMCCPADIVEQKLSAGANPNEQDHLGNTVLHKLSKTIYFNDRMRQVFTCLFKAGADPNTQNVEGQTPLHMVKIADVCDILLDKGANINQFDTNERTPLLEIVMQSVVTNMAPRDTALVKVLLVNGADISITDNSGNTVPATALWHNSDSILKLILENVPFSQEALSALLRCATENQRFHMFPVLLQNGAPPTAAYDGLSLHTALAVLHLRFFITREFIEHKREEINIENALGESPLIIACYKDYVDVVGPLLENEAKVDGIDRNGSTALFHCKSAACAKLLLKAGADPNKRNDHGDYPCTVVIKAEVVRELLQAGANIHIRGKDGQTPLARAGYLGEEDTMELILSHQNKHLEITYNVDGSALLDTSTSAESSVRQFNVNEQDFMGQTELMRAIESNHTIIDLLNDEKACPNVVDDANQTALSLAASKSDTSKVEQLLKYGADCNIGTSPLIEAFIHDRVWTIGLLLGEGQCNPNQTNSFGETLLISAINSGSKHKNQVLRMLKTRKDLDVNVTDEHGRSLLQLAAALKSDLLTHVPFLINHGADFTRTDPYGRTILHHWQPRSDSLAQLAFGKLLRMHIDVNHQDYNGHTAMHLAVMEQDGEARRKKCNELLKFGADLNIQDKNGLTVYHLATHDAQLFRMLMTHASKDFQDNALSLLHTLSRWFKTEESIFEMTTNRKLPMTNVCGIGLFSVESNANITFHHQSAPLDMVEWTKNLADHFCDIGHRQFFTEKLAQDILCSYPEEKMAELQEKARTVISLFVDIAREMGKLDKMMEFTPYISGSCNEGTKVILPDEMDMLCVLHNFKDLFLTHQGPCPSLMVISRKLEDKYHPFFRKTADSIRRDFTMNHRQVFKYFYFLFGKALQNKLLWKKYPKLYRIETYDMSHKNQTITDLSLVWHGDHFPFLKFSVDVVPAFNTSWLPGKALEHPLLKRNGFLLIPKFRVEHIQNANAFTPSTDLFQASFERSEADLFHIMPVELKQAYMLAKIVKSMLPNIELQPSSLFYTSYLLKTCTFGIFQDHPEYQERLHKFISSEKVSAALTQQPYDPQPLAPVADIIHWCRQIFIRLEQAMAARTLYGFFLPGYNLLQPKVYKENYRPQLWAQIGRTMLLDPAVEPQAWKHLAEAQPWRIADVDRQNRLEIESADLCTCHRYFCAKKHHRSK